MNALQRVREVLDQPRERHAERSAPADQHIVIARHEPGRVRKPHNFAQSPPHAIALHRIADLLRHRKADPWRPCVVSRAGLQHERSRGSPGTGRDAEKIRPLPQSFHGSGPPAGSGAEPLPAARPSGIEHPATALGGHPAPETMAALAHQFARLIGPLHEVFSDRPGGAPMRRPTCAKPFRFEPKYRVSKVGAAVKVGAYTQGRRVASMQAGRTPAKDGIRGHDRSNGGEKGVRSGEAFDIFDTETVETPG